MTIETLVVVLAGGEGTRLKPLTETRTKPAVPIGGKYRLIDIPLSNAFNSDLNNVLVLTQGKDKSLNRHIKNAWPSDPRSRSFVEVISPQGLGEVYEGDADAVRQVMQDILAYNPKNVLVVPGDHLLKMDYSLFVNFMTKRDGDFAIGVIPRPIEQAKHLGALQLDKHSGITALDEKNPNTAFRTMNPDEFYASMGIYAAKTEKMLEALEKEGTLFGKHIIPAILKDMKVIGYDYIANNFIPERARINRDGFMVLGERKNSLDSAYWRDVGTLKELFEANMDSVSITPKFNKYNPEWRFFTTNTNMGPGKQVAGPKTSIVSEGSTLTNVRGSDVVVSPNVYIDDCDLEQVIVFDNSDIQKSRMRRTIVDKNAVIRGMEIGFNASQDERNDIYIDQESGIRVVRKFYNSTAKKA